MNSQNTSDKENIFDEIEEVTDDISDVGVLDVPVMLIFVLLFFIVALQFFTRYVLNDSLGWTEEIARYLLILLAFVGSVSCVRKGKHIYLEFFYRYLPEGFIKPISSCVEAVVMGMFGYMAWLGIELAQKTKSQRMVSLDLPKSVIYYIVVIACVAMAIFAANRIARLYKMSAREVAAEKLSNLD